MSVAAVFFFFSVVVVSLAWQSHDEWQLSVCQSVSQKKWICPAGMHCFLNHFTSFCLQTHTDTHTDTHTHTHTHTHTYTYTHTRTHTHTYTHTHRHTHACTHTCMHMWNIMKFVSEHVVFTGRYLTRSVTRGTWLPTLASSSWRTVCCWGKSNRSLFLSISHIQNYARTCLIRWLEILTEYRKDLSYFIIFKPVKMQKFQLQGKKKTTYKTETYYII